MLSSIIEDRTDGDLADRLVDEGRASLDVQVDTLSKIDEKAGKLLRVNVLLLGLLLSAFSFLTNQEVVRDGGDIFNTWTSLGFFLLLVSSALAAITFTASDAYSGLSQNAISTLLDGEHSNVAKIEGIAEGYGEWIDETGHSVITNALRISATAIFLVYSLTFLSIGVFDAVVRDVSNLEIKIAILILAIFTFYSGIIGHLKQWNNVTSPKERLIHRISPKTYL